MKDVIVIGGGLAGLINAILLARAGLSVLLIEKKRYPQHRVCGEYISNEVRPFLERNGLFPTELAPANITQFQLTSIRGKSATLNLDLGAFAVSRYELDYFLYQKAVEAGVECYLNTSVAEVQFQGDHFIVEARNREPLTAKIVIGAFGKRSNLDKKMDRTFAQKKSPYVGVKYHIKTDFPAHTVALHNFENGYCGINKIEGTSYNLCYLSHRKNLKKHGNVKRMEAAVLHENPYLKELFCNSDFVLERPKVINEISFAKKQAVEQHILMSGDAAGMITPLCGNGMAMAIHSAKLLSDTILAHWQAGNFHRSKLEQAYTQKWNKLFATRLWTGRQIQALFGSRWISEVAVGLVHHVQPLANFLMKQTHGKTF
ncbi:MAG: NAD(P)/FAD-dependent oxidoreductase [Bacteroidota bacterium]